MYIEVEPPLFPLISPTEPKRESIVVGARFTHEKGSIAPEYYQNRDAEQAGIYIPPDIHPEEFVDGFIVFNDVYDNRESIGNGLIEEEGDFCNVGNYVIFKIESEEYFGQPELSGDRYAVVYIFNDDQ